MVQSICKLAVTAMRHQSLWLRFGFALASLWLRFGFALDSLWLRFGFALASLWLRFHCPAI